MSRVVAGTMTGTAFPAIGPLKAYLELTKPRLSLLVLVTTAAGYWIGRSTAEPPDAMLPTLIGTALVVGGANALNQWMECVPDALMRRTRHRPLPAGALSPSAAKWFGLLLVVGGVVWLALAAGVLCAALAALAATLYLLVYTPLKQRTALCTLAGAIPGALPPMIGWAAARQTLDVGAWALFGILLLWQLPHFLAIAVLYRDDYARAGFRMLPITEPSGHSTARQTALYGLVLLPVSLFPAMIGLGGATYFYGALGLGLVFCAAVARAALIRSIPACRQLFLASVLYLPLLLGLLAADRAAP